MLLFIVDDFADFCNTAWINRELTGKVKVNRLRILDLLCGKKFI